MYHIEMMAPSNAIFMSDPVIYFHSFFSSPDDDLAVDWMTMSVSVVTTETLSQRLVKNSQRLELWGYGILSLRHAVKILWIWSTVQIE